MQEKLADLAERREQAINAGSQRSVDRQHEKGKMLARERIEYFLDPGSFQELDLPSVVQPVYRPRQVQPVRQPAPHRAPDRLRNVADLHPFERLVRVPRYLVLVAVDQELPPEPCDQVVVRPRLHVERTAKPQPPISRDRAGHADFGDHIVHQVAIHAMTPKPDRMTARASSSSTTMMLSPEASSTRIANTSGLRSGRPTTTGTDAWSMPPRT